jgi:hypothetical protein
MHTTARVVRAREEIEDDHHDHLAVRSNLDDGAERVVGQRLWALFMLARTPEVAGSIARLDGSSPLPAQAGLSPQALYLGKGPPADPGCIILVLPFLFLRC